MGSVFVFENIVIGFISHTPEIHVVTFWQWIQYSDTSANEDNSFRNHIR